MRGPFSFRGRQFMRECADGIGGRREVAGAGKSAAAAGAKVVIAIRGPMEGD
jgi:hypothetical protein